MAQSGSIPSPNEALAEAIQEIQLPDLAVDWKNFFEGGDSKLKSYIAAIQAAEKRVDEVPDKTRNSVHSLLLAILCPQINLLQQVLPAALYALLRDSIRTKGHEDFSFSSNSLPATKVSETCDSTRNLEQQFLALLSYWLQVQPLDDKELRVQSQQTEILRLMQGYTTLLDKSSDQAKRITCLEKERLDEKHKMAQLLTHSSTVRQELENEKSSLLARNVDLGEQLEREQERHQKVLELNLEMEGKIGVQQAQESQPLAQPADSPPSIINILEDASMAEDEAASEAPAGNQGDQGDGLCTEVVDLQGRFTDVKSHFDDRQTIVATVGAPNMQMDHLDLCVEFTLQLQTKIQDFQKRLDSACPWIYKALASDANRVDDLLLQLHKVFVSTTPTTDQLHEILDKVAARGWESVYLETQVSDCPPMFPPVKTTSRAFNTFVYHQEQGLSKNGFRLWSFLLTPRSAQKLLLAETSLKDAKDCWNGITTRNSPTGTPYQRQIIKQRAAYHWPVSYTHLRAHET